jgi:hypothetical protein
MTVGTLSPNEKNLYKIVHIVRQLTEGRSNYSRPTFSADLNGSDQTGIISATPTKLNFNHENYDIGSCYDAANAKWTPSAGLVLIIIKVQFKGINVIDQTQYFSQLYKNGAQYLNQLSTASGAGAVAPVLMVFDFASGTDYYEAYCQGGAAAEGNKTVNGSAVATFFQGVVLS